jgi:hypothetical protein
LVYLAVQVEVLQVQVAVVSKQAVLQLQQVKAALVAVLYLLTLQQVVAVQPLLVLMPHQLPQVTAVMVQALIPLGVLQQELVRTLQELFGMQVVEAVDVTALEQVH